MRLYTWPRVAVPDAAGEVPGDDEVVTQLA